MAEEEKKEGENGEAEGEGKSSKKTIIIIAIVAILSIGASVGATLFLLSGDSEEVAEEVADEPAEPIKAPAIYYDIKPPFLVTFDVGGRQRYLQVHASIMARESSIFDAVELHMPLIRNKIIGLYSGLDFDALRTSEGKQAMREQTLSTINDVLAAEGAEPIENIFFTNLVMQ